MMSTILDAARLSALLAEGASMHHSTAQGPDDGAPIREMLAGLDPAMRQTFTETVALLREHPLWAVWMPAGHHDWTAARPASSRPPGPDLPMVWVHAATPTELADLMRAADTQLPATPGCYQR
jgi:hypothetical protein